MVGGSSIDKVKEGEHVHTLVEEGALVPVGKTLRDLKSIQD
jgi:hypothetical protein